MPEFNELKKALPTSFTSFTELRQRGASTLLSTVEELFLHGLEPYDGHDSYFKGLSIEKTWQDQGHYLVLHLDFYKLNSLCDTVAEFEQNLRWYVDDFCRRQQLRLPENIPNLSIQLDQMLSQLPANSLVLLVDEYDAPLLYHAQDERELHEAGELLRCLFGMVKSNSRKFRCVFFTGITRFQDLDLGTAGNSFTDISMDSAFAACCGYTREELKQSFADHLRYSAAVRLGIRDEEVTEENIESLLDEMSTWYDGYSFDGRQGSHVFSTWSVLRFFGDEEARLQPYWSSEEGLGLPRLLKLSLDRMNIGGLLQEISAGEIEAGARQFLQSSLINPKANPYALMFQTGYLTLKTPFTLSGTLNLDCPNREISMAFANLVGLSLFRKEEDRFTENYSGKTVAVLKSLDPEKLRSYFNPKFRVKCIT